MHNCTVKWRDLFTTQCIVKVYSAPRLRICIYLQCRVFHNENPVNVCAITCCKFNIRFRSYVYVFGVWSVLCTYEIFHYVNETYPVGYMCSLGMYVRDISVCKSNIWSCGILVCHFGYVISVMYVRNNSVCKWNIRCGIFVSFGVCDQGLLHKYST